MSVLIRSHEAARLLGVSRATLYAYVSRGRLTRTTASDGRTSLYSREEVVELADRSRRSSPGPRPTIDVNISSTVTTIDADAVRYRGHDVAGLARHGRFEDVAELLWSAPAAAPAGTVWPSASRTDLATVEPARRSSATPVGRLAIAAHLLDVTHGDEEPPDAARRLLLVAPAVLGSARRSGPFARRLASAWRRAPDDALVAAVDAALVLLADHELATSTLAVRIAASVRTTSYVALAAGLAAVEGRAHGAAAGDAHRFLQTCADDGVGPTVERLRRSSRVVPGFGHKVYRGVDPRFEPLMDRVRELDPTGDRATLVDRTVSEVGRAITVQPNVDLALGALTWSAGLDPDVPVFAVARVAGWGAHVGEELAEPPVRFRGVAD